MAWDFWQAFNSVLRLMVSNPFYLIFLLVFALMIPLSLLGILKLGSWLDNWSKVRSGWIKIRKKLSNGRWVEMWAKPTGRKVKLKGEEGYEFELPVRIEKDYMGFQSHLKGDFQKAKNPSSSELRDLVKGDKDNLKVETYG